MEDFMSVSSLKLTLYGSNYFYNGKGYRWWKVSIMNGKKIKLFVFWESKFNWILSIKSRTKYWNKLSPTDGVLHKYSKLQRSLSHRVILQYVVFGDWVSLAISKGGWKTYLFKLFIILRRFHVAIRVLLRIWTLGKMIYRNTLELKCTNLFSFNIILSVWYFFFST